MSNLTNIVCEDKTDDIPGELAVEHRSYQLTKKLNSSHQNS